MKKWESFGWPLLTLAILVALWSLISSFGLVPEFLLPHPQSILQSFQEMQSDYLTAFFSTAKTTFVGLVFSCVIGFAIALIFSISPLLKKCFLPFAVFFQTVPVIALAPLLVIWFGFGEPTVIASAFIVSVFPVLANSLIGLTQTDPALLEMFRSFGAKPGQILWKLRVPASFSFVLAGCEIASGLAVIGAIVGEFVAGGGLGGLIDSARTQQRVDIVFAAVILSSVLGIVFVSLLRIAKQTLLKFRPFHG